MHPPQFQCWPQFPQIRMIFILRHSKCLHWKYMNQHVSVECEPRENKWNKKDHWDSKKTQARPQIPLCVTFPLIYYRLYISYQSKYEWPWLWPSGSLKVKCDGVIGLPIYGFLLTFNRAFGLNLLLFETQVFWNLSDLDFDPSGSLKGQMWWCHWTPHIWFPIDI